MTERLATMDQEQCAWNRGGSQGRCWLGAAVWDRFRKAAVATQATAKNYLAGASLILEVLFPA